MVHNFGLFYFKLCSSTKQNDPPQTIIRNSEMKGRVFFGNTADTNPRIFIVKFVKIGTHNVPVVLRTNFAFPI